MTTLLQSALDAGRTALLTVAGRTVAFPDHGMIRAQAVIDEAPEDRDRRRSPDGNMRRGAVVDVGVDCLGFAPAAGEYLIDDVGRRLRIATVSRRVNLYRLECEFTS
jgi:hypothetical protein